MASERQIAANRANAGRSTGPKTKAGKVKSSRNSLKHGLSGSKNRSSPNQKTGPTITETQLTLARIRRVRVELVAAVLESPKPRLIKQLRGLDRYEQAALARRKRAAREHNDWCLDKTNPIQPKDSVEIVAVLRNGHADIRNRRASD